MRIFNQLKRRQVSVIAVFFSVMLLSPISASQSLFSERFIQPDPAFSAENVVSIQLTALQNNDKPVPNAGIIQTYLMAHPANRAITGPLPRFARLFSSQDYRHLLSHQSHEIIEITDEIEQPNDDATNQQRVFAIRVTNEQGAMVAYQWTVSKYLGDGVLNNTWLTTAVSPAFALGQSL